MNKKNPAAMRCIKDRSKLPHPSDEFQVQLVRNKKVSAGVFHFRSGGGKAKALKAAQSWRDQMMCIHGDGEAKFHKKPMKNNKIGYVGVSRTQYLEKRRGYDVVEYQVHWKRAGKSKTKTFYLGKAENVTPELEEHALKTAVMFRKEWEKFCENEKDFDDKKYNGWKKKKLYENTEFEHLVTGKTEESEDIKIQPEVIANDQNQSSELSESERMRKVLENMR